MLIYFILGLVAVLIVFGVLIYNRLVSRSQMADNGWSDIDVQLKRRANLIPQLVSTVQGYASHERELFADVAEKRARALAAGDDLAGEVLEFHFLKLPDFTFTLAEAGFVLE